ncbi:RNA polymerase sigma factor [Nocardioides sp. B-3]|uniref:RNA polymerase sigma factor n=1 Tax=Nocardioides sp. B-3 TaxID=2895565 RepID=UPI003FA53864
MALLVNEARGGSQSAWNQLVERLLPLVTSLIRRHRLFGADADDVNQTVWLRLVEHLDRIDEPRALPGWLATVTLQREPALPAEAQPDGAGGSPGVAGVRAGRRVTRPDRRTDGDRAALGAGGCTAGAAGRPSGTPAPAHRRPSTELRGDQPTNRHPRGQHRADPGPRDRPAAQEPGTATPHPTCP